VVLDFFGLVCDSFVSNRDDFRLISELAESQQNRPVGKDRSASGTVPLRVMSAV